MIFDKTIELQVLDGPIEEIEETEDKPLMSLIIACLIFVPGFIFFYFVLIEKTKQKQQKYDESVAADKAPKVLVVEIGDTERGEDELKMLKL